ncbi:MAG TPA: M15 family metallopeptidase [Pseudonocardiaceae bacterium]|nr:M15 family metallopeptidase [Pseudonocardiaceae bacterium]
MARDRDRTRRAVVAVLLGGLLAGCAAPQPATRSAADKRTEPSGPAPTSTLAGPPSIRSATPAPPPANPPPANPLPAGPPPAPQRPGWVVGATPLPLRPDGFGQVLPTPDVLADRRLPTADRLPPPGTDEYAWTASTVPPAVVARSTWHPGCPVRLDELRYLTVSFWGFDGRHHTGELLVNGRVAGPVVEVFRQLHADRFPIEEMRVVTAAELTVAPTGDGNNTQAFVCRPLTGLAEWSAHASGLAVDLNPFCNPYQLGDLVLPELASAYTNRARVRPGMVLPGGGAVTAFARAGWSWGGTWTGRRDWMHFTATGG